MDHMEFLGDTIEKIAFEKAGIIKANVPCVISAQQEEVSKLLMTIADNVDAESFVFEYDWSIEETEQGVNYLSSDGDIYDLKPSLAGRHQYLNMGNAITAVKRFVSIDDEIIKRAVSKTKWQARIEKLPIGRLQKEDGFDVWIDGAHNKLGSHVLSLWLEEQNVDNIYLILGITKGRDIKNFLSSFTPGQLKLIAGVNVNYEPKSYSGLQVSEQAAQAGFVAQGFEYIEDAIEHIKSTMPKGIIMITGSLFLAGEAISKNKYSYKNKLHS
jgi:dihydrofolate synthase/folylpolyglutamate synthase